MNRRLPVTLVGGFLGAGKTSLLHHIISEHQGGHLAVLVENPGPLNIDAKALQGLCGAMRRSSDVVLEIPSIDETSQIEWMTDRLRELSQAGRFERVLVEIGGTANAARLGRYFGLRPGNADPFAPWAELHQIVCVVDALDLFHTSQNASRDSMGNFRRAQVGGASLLVLNKFDLLQDSERQHCTGLLRSINPHAKIIETDYGEVPQEVWSRPAPLSELRSALEPRGESKIERSDKPSENPPELACAVYRAYRPFHPQRFWDWFQTEHPGLMRMKGLFWLATRNLLVGGVSRTSRENACGPAGIWWAALPREEWPEDPEALLRMQETWREPYGDRRQELVLLGEARALHKLTDQLDACLLNAQEISQPVKDWTMFPDPFPEWDLNAT